MTPLDLRPLSLGELLDRVFTLFRRHLVLFVGIMTLPAIVGLAYVLMLGLLGITGLPGFPWSEPELETGGPPSGPVIVFFIVTVVVFVLASWIAYMLSFGAVVVAVADLYAGRAATIRSSYARARGSLGRLMLLSLLACIRVIGPILLLGVVSAVLVGLLRTRSAVVGALLGLTTFFVFLAAVLLGLYLMLRYAVSVPALVLEGTSAAGGLRRSVVLTRGDLVRPFVLGLCATMVAYASAMVFQVPFMVAAALAGPSATGIALNLVGAVSGTIGSTLTSPLMVVGFAVLYYDLRVRKEALDLQMMLQALDAGGPSAGDVPPVVSPPSVPPLPGLPD